ncbi:reversion-inducing cysteine-rich protein with Kazal motifs [Melanaphis sacchari]|uniref:reversion-inducing cysteine-rich protein with Kazal motifs n=1 Tax=Melanaphis sacchari TaxID=742174 RepID=UPI000DC13A6D|nr:reversion-inducing cysteine-rich protein with Kazal motifs [Melanaphis sacchari]
MVHIILKTSDHSIMLVVYLLLVLCTGRFIDAEKAKCCGRVTGNCKRACEQLAVLQEYPKDKIAGRITDFYNHCSPKNVQHVEWCMSSSAQDTEIKWLDAARKCCDVARSDGCQLSCLNRNAGSRSVHRDCQDETDFFNCLQHQQVKDTCCGDKTDAAQCQIACEKFLANTPSINRHAANQEILDLCSADRRDTRSATTTTTSVELHRRCTRNTTTRRTSSDGHKYLHCCKLAADTQCEQACQDSLRRKFDSDVEAVDSLEGRGCGPPSLDDRFWQCFLQSERAEQKDTSAPAPMSQIEKLGMDSVKLHCCDKATIAGCRKLCLKTFTNEWSSSWNDFNFECLSHPNEDRLLKCLDDVEEPCDLGCDGLNYCTAFNNRPTELFRSCSPQTDDAAHYDVTLWRQRGTITLFNYEIPLKNITKCMPDSWKAVACILQIRPCTRQTHVNKICRDDCLELLSTCLDWTNSAPGMSANSLCARLSPESGPCVPLGAFAELGAPRLLSPRLQNDRQTDLIQHTAIDLPEVTTPCKRNPCAPGSVCLVNRGCKIGGGCKPYRCVAGCKAGEVSHFLVPEDSYARIPTFNGQKGCVKICLCTKKGIEKCQQVPCSQIQSCWLVGKPIDHGSTFEMDCNTCNCFAGEITCTKKHCEPTTVNAVSRYRHTGLPCNCAPHHVPVCGSNGNTYPNSCLAKCAGLSDVDLKFGTCWNDDPCAGDHTCRSDERCVPTRQVCLSMLKKSCVQYKCVSEKTSCEDVTKSVVCDTDDVEHSNLCHLLRSGKTLAYNGPCLVGCNSTGSVCGVDGNTYPSECAAFAESASVDYPGPCISSGFIGHNGRPYCAAKGVVNCPRLPHKGCLGITPPGACCPKCAGALRILFSQKQVDRVMHTLKKPSVNALNTKSILRALDRHVLVAECVVRGHLTMYQDLLVLVESTVRNPTRLQLEACIRESEKLSSLVETSSPRVMIDLSLSTLISASPVHEMVADDDADAAAAAPDLQACAATATFTLILTVLIR